MSALSTCDDAPVATRWRAVSRSHVGLVRRINEDRLFDGSDRGVWAVVDGMGGHSGGDLAAQQVVDTLRAACAGPMDFDTLLAALQDGHAAIHARNARLGTAAGATVVAAVSANGELAVLWAGDSRAYWIDDDGVTPLTRDHSFVQQLVDEGLIDSAAAATHPRAHVVTRALGITPAVTIDCTARRMSAGRLLLCSDGLSRSLSNADLTLTTPLTETADRLIGNALTRDGSDNTSLVLIEFC